MSQLHAAEAVDLDDPQLHVNRELSWLEFNRRVLAQAIDADVPLLERLRFLAIFASNLDEFFMVRVAGLKSQVAAGVTETSPDGLTPHEQLKAISRRLRPMVDAAADCLHRQLVPLLARNGLAIVPMHDLAADQRTNLERYFEETVFPVLTPLAVDPGHPFPYISSLSLSLAVTVYDPTTGRTHFARVKVPEVLPRFVTVGLARAFVPLEELIAANLSRLFPGMDVIESHGFRVTRNADLELEEDEAEDLLMAVEQELRRRRFGAVVRLEVAEDMPGYVVDILRDELDVDEVHTYPVPGMLGLGDLTQLADLDIPRLRWKPWTPRIHPRFARPEPDNRPADSPLPPADLFAAIRRGDILVRHPYDSFRHTVERFITAASEDPYVLAIKQTLYRTSGDSPIVKALIRAAEQGKQVAALVELKARFDEQANIAWARTLEKAGVHVVYGLVGLKTHSKTSLVVRRERDGLRRYVHIGTGNYNPKTAALYTDLGLLSCRPALGADLTDLFNYLTGYSRQETYRELLVAPVALRNQLAALIQRQIDVQRAERRGLIRAKLNSLIDERMITDLYRASQAGVQVDLIVRGICGLRPGVPGVSDHIRVISVVGRLLEHERVVQFGHDDFYIGSADWMPRNLDRRVEVLTPVQDPELREELRHIMDVTLADNVQAWTLGPDGSWTRRTPGDGEEPLASQEHFMAHASHHGDPDSPDGSRLLRLAST
ncbi:MAG: RNA degradosome polyphosphate kinase [Egibacteraceae bacterium]